MRWLWRKFQLWLYTKLWVLAVALNSGMRRRRMTHNNGVLGRGRLRIVDDPQFPDCEFFEPSREFDCRVRHGSANYMDDCMRVVRSGSIKFADTRWKSPFDLEMNTGKRNFFWTAYLFLYCGITRRPTKDGHAYLAYFKNVEGGRVAAQDGFRRRAESFAFMHFQSQVPLGFTAKDGKPRYVKFRLIPGDRRPDSGFAEPTALDTPEHLADFRVLPDETRGRNYLKEEYRERVAAQPVEYILQLALHEVSPEDSPEILNSNEPWDEETHPWMDLAHVTIDKTTDYRESVLTSFSLNHLPKSIHVLPANSIHDYNSINYMRKRVGMARRFRLFFIAIFGLPEEYAGDGERNIRAPGA